MCYFFLFDLQGNTSVLTNLIENHNRNPFPPTGLWQTTDANYAGSFGSWKHRISVPALYARLGSFENVSVFRCWHLTGREALQIPFTWETVAF